MKFTAFMMSLFAGSSAAASRLSVGMDAPEFVAKTHDGATFKLSDRKNKWTVLYFYPKDDTPGCTKQACAFRDSIDIIRAQGAQVYGISKDDASNHQKFVKKYNLNFPLLADPDGKIIKTYGASGMLGFAKRWTFIIGPDQKVKWIQTEVDPALNAQMVADQLKNLGAKP